MELSCRATTTLTSSLLVPAVAASAPPALPPISVLLWPFVNFHFPPFLPKPRAVLAARKSKTTELPLDEIVMSLHMFFIMFYIYRCVLRGCVPKKLLVYASKFSHEFDESNGFGWKYGTEPQHDWSTLIANKNAELQRLTGIYKNILINAGVTLIEGRGKVGL